MWSFRLGGSSEDTCLSTYLKFTIAVVLSYCWKQKHFCIVSARVSRVWLEVSVLSVHSICDELLIHPHYIDQCREMFGLVFSNISTSRYYSTTEPGMPSWFATTQERNIILWEIWIYKCLLWFLSSCFSLTHILHSPKDTHKGLWLPFNWMNYPLDCKVRFPPSLYKM
jgi:hypothetical protein